MKMKEFKNLDEQIDILRKKGLTIKDEEYTKNILLRENYFFLMGYRHLFIDNNNEVKLDGYKEKKFLPGTRFEELYSLFLFDRSLRNIVFKYLLVIENNFKSVTSYVLSRKYGYKEKEYLRPENFTNKPEQQRQVNDLISKMKRQIRINGPQHSATQHYSYNYGYIPLWILVKVLSFGIVSELFQILKEEDKREVSRTYDVEIDDLLNYLPILANYRNLCAHEDILFENRTSKPINDTIYHRLLKVPQEDGEFICGKNDLFALVIILKQLLSKEDFKNFILELDNVISSLNYNLYTIKIEKVYDRIGFPSNWKDIMNIERRLDNEAKE